MPKGPGTPASPGSPLSPGRPVQGRGEKNNTMDTPHTERMPFTIRLNYNNSLDKKHFLEGKCETITVKVSFKGLARVCRKPAGLAFLKRSLSESWRLAWLLPDSDFLPSSLLPLEPKGAGSQSGGIPGGYRGLCQLCVRMWSHRLLPGACPSWPWRLSLGIKF